MEESLSSRFQARSDANPAVQPQKMARGLKIRIWVKGIAPSVKQTEEQVRCMFDDI